MRDLYELKRYWSQHKDEQLALGTLIKKTGSGYHATGAKKIISRTQGACGFLSGGCLEVAIEKTVRERWDVLPFRESFSTLNEGDRVFGYQIGCAGEIEILFEALPADDSESELYLPFGSCSQAAGVGVMLTTDNLAKREFAATEIEPREDIFFDKWRRPVELAIVGCGADADLFAQLAMPLGWTLRFFDYRPSFAQLVTGALCLSPAEIAQTLPTGSNAAVVLMTHNYQADLDILARLIGKNISYVGCLGPRVRYLRMKQDLYNGHKLIVPPDWEECVHAPAGFFQGHTAEAIALSIMAQIQSVTGVAIS